jgi:hypothetical protein
MRAQDPVGRQDICSLKGTLASAGLEFDGKYKRGTPLSFAVGEGTGYWKWSFDRLLDFFLELLNGTF